MIHYTKTDEHPTAQNGMMTLAYDNDTIVNAGRDLIRVYRSEMSRHEIIGDLIEACIAEGIDTRDGIVAMVPKLGPFQYAFVAYMLKRCTGTDPDTAAWSCGDDGKYRLLAA